MVEFEGVNVERKEASAGGGRLFVEKRCLFDSIVAKIRKTRCKSISTRLHDLEELYSDFDLFYE